MGPEEPVFHQLSLKHLHPVREDVEDVYLIGGKGLGEVLVQPLKEVTQNNKGEASIKKLVFIGKTPKF